MLNSSVLTKSVAKASKKWKPDDFAAQSVTGDSVVVRIPCREDEEPREFFLGKAKIVLYKC